MTIMTWAAASLLAAFPYVSAASDAVPTRILVRAVARDAKIIGSGVGGARIQIREVESGRILAQGLQKGGTGNTERIMKTARERGGSVFQGPGAGFFMTELKLSRPVWVDISAEGPLDAPQSMSRASKRVLLVPGRHIQGDGLILELHGYRMLLESPVEDTVAPGATIPIRINLRMLCGCPIEPGGLWDADRIEVTARLWEGDKVVAESPLSFSGETSVFVGEIPVGEAGELVLEVLAIDGEAVNFGRILHRFLVTSAD